MVNIIDVAYTYMCLGDHHLHKCIKCSLKTIEDYYFKIFVDAKTTDVLLSYRSNVQETSVYW